MGTRGLTCIFKDGKYPLSQYGQWDHRAQDQGLDALRIIRSSLADIRANVDRVYTVGEDENVALWSEIGVDIVACKGWALLDQCDRFKKRYPSLSRDTGADVLKLVADLGPDDRLPVQEMLAFNEQRDCRGIFVLDLDANMFEVFGQAGCNEPSTRFKNYPMAKSYPLSDLPSDEAFVAYFEEAERIEEKED